MCGWVFAYLKANNGVCLIKGNIKCQGEWLVHFGFVYLIPKNETIISMYGVVAANLTLFWFYLHYFMATKSFHQSKMLTHVDIHSMGFV